jgi:drug/metabolite transporter (DMT)-like permease
MAETFASAGMLLMGLDAVFVRMSGTDGWNSSFLFGAFSFLSMAALTQFTAKGGILTAVRDGGLPIVLSGLIMGGSGTTFVLAVNETLVANVLLIISTSPVFAALYGRLLLGEKTGRKTWIAIGVSMAGIFIITGGSAGRGSITGDLLAVLCTMFASLNYVVWRKYPKMSRTMAVSFGGAGIAGASVFFAEPSGLSVHTYLVMAVMGLVTAPLGRVLVSQAARLLPATEVSMFSLVRIFVAPLLIWLIFGEMPSLSTFAGGIVLVANLVVFVSTQSSKS